LGFTGPPAILEGPKGFFAAACPDANPEAVVADPDAAWQLVQTSIKPWPCCRHTHPVVDAAIELHGKRSGRDIASVQIDTYQAALDVCDRAQPDNEYAAKFSLHHTVAVALANGQVGFDSFNAGARDDYAALRELVNVAATEPFKSAYPDQWGARVTAALADGETIVAERPVARGDPELALDDEQMLSKARMLLDYAGCDASTSQRIIDGILGLVEVQSCDELVEFLLFLSKSKP
jgi:2-methylcitrate dehydratase PrpD